MGETKFTKGQWFACCGSYEVAVLNKEKFIDILITDTGPKSIPDDNEAKANQDLIAAAPDMYKMLEDILNNYDLIIYEYFVNDNNYYLRNINNVDRVKKTLIEITNMCIQSNTKLLFIFIYRKNDKIEGKYNNSEMFSLYKEPKPVFIPYIGSEDEEILLSK